MPLKRLTRITLLAALCVVLRQAFAFLPNVQPISAIFFLLVLFEDWPFACLVMAVTMFTSAFLLGMSPVVVAQILVFALLLTLWRGLCHHLSLEVQTLVVGILSFLYGMLIDSVYAVLYHMPWWTYALINGFSFNLAHAFSTVCFYPLLYTIFRRFYHEKNTL